MSNQEETEKESEDEERQLQTLLQEIRILVPGAQVVGGVQFSIPFQSRFESLSHADRVVFLFTFASTLMALLLFLAPATYHRLCSPVHERSKFVTLGTRFLIAGFVALAVSISLSAYLVATLTLGPGAGGIAAGAVGAFLACAWWVPSMLRVHEWVRAPGPSR